MKISDLSLISYMYFKKDMSQSEIAEKLGLSKVAVSRLLQKAKKDNIYVVTVKLPFDRNEKYEKIIKEKFFLKEVIVAKGEKIVNGDISERIGKIGAFYLNMVIRDNSTLGVGIGHTIGHLVNYLTPMKMKNVHIVQLQGGLASVEYYNPFTILQKICERFSAQGTYITSSAIVDSREQRDSIIYSPPIGTPIVEKWKKCDIALFGIGTIDESSFIVPNIVGKSEIEEVKKKGSVGNIMGHCFNARGEFLDTQIEERLVAIPINMLMNIPERVAVAGGIEKVTAIKGALTSGVVTTLIIDEDSAGKIINAG